MRAARTQLGAQRGEEQFHVQLELQRESRGRRDLITSAGPGPRPPRFKHLSVAGDAGGVLIGIICQLFGTSWHVVHTVSQCSGLGGFWGTLRLFWKVGESHRPGWLPRPWCGAGDWWKGLQNRLPAGEECSPGGFCLQFLVHRLRPQQVGTGIEREFQAQPKHPPCLTVLAS